MKCGTRTRRGRPAWKSTVSGSSGDVVLQQVDLAPGSTFVVLWHSYPPHPKATRDARAPPARTGCANERRKRRKDAGRTRPEDLPLEPCRARPVGKRRRGRAPIRLIACNSFGSSRTSKGRRSDRRHSPEETMTQPISKLSDVRPNPGPAEPLLYRFEAELTVRPLGVVPEAGGRVAWCPPPRYRQSVRVD